MSQLWRRRYVRERGRHDWASVYARIGCRPGHPDYDRLEFLDAFRRSSFGRALIRGPFLIEQAYPEPLFPKLLFP